MESGPSDYRLVLVECVWFNSLLTRLSFLNRGASYKLRGTIYLFTGCLKKSLKILKIRELRYLLATFGITSSAAGDTLT